MLTAWLRTVLPPLQLPNGQRSKTSWIVRSIWVAAVLFCSLSAVVLASDDDSQRAVADGQRPIGDLRKDVKAFVKRSKLADDPVASVGAIIDLCRLHTEIVNDPRFASNRQLQSFRAVAASRLKKYAKEVELEIKRRKRRDDLEAKQAGRATSAAPDAAGPGNHGATFTGDRVTSGRNPEANLDRYSFPSSGQDTDPEVAISDSMARDAYAMSTFGGGPVQVWTHVGGNFAPPWDHGPELVALIESTIDPQSWKSRGGNGVIHYYRPLRILVVSASSSVQDDVTNMLRNLRRLSR